MHASRQSSYESAINVTPLVDVCLVLLIIFMVITPTLVTGVPVQLPRSSTAGPMGEATRQLSITVKDDGTVFVDALVLRREQVRSELVRLHDALPRRPVGVRGDQRVPYGDIMSVLDACRAAGYENVGLISESRSR